MSNFLTLICADIHGKFLSMYKYALEKGVTSILNCGDLECLRTLNDLEYFPSPSKYVREYRESIRPLEFAEYLNGVPIPTYAIAGNHEPWDWLENYRKQGLHELVPNLHYFGTYGLAQVETGVGKLNVAGFSKIFHEEHSLVENYVPWDRKAKRLCSPKLASYFNEEDIYNLIDLCKGRDIDILLLHENPAKYRGNKLEYGCDLITELVRAISPKIAFCGHMHFKDERVIDNTVVVNLPLNQYFILEEEWWGSLWMK